MSSEPTVPQRWTSPETALLADTRSSRLWTVRRPDGSLAVAKVLKPAGIEELRGAHYLAWRSGKGAVRLLDREGRAMLLEYGGETPLLRRIDEIGDPAATEIAADALARLLSPSRRAAPTQLIPLSQHFGGLFARARKVGADDRLCLEAAEVAYGLLASTTDTRPLHGDLHHDNIMLGGRGWLAIDPHGAIGDPCFEAANLFFNPLGRDDLCLDESRIAMMASCLAQALRLDPRRILDFAFAYGCLSAAWHAEDGKAVDEARELSVAETVRTVRRLSF